MAKFSKSDLKFILDQIRIAERHADGEDLFDLLPNVQVPFGLRTIDGSYNNLVFGQSAFGAADHIFPRMLMPVFRPAENGTSYMQTSGNVFDSQPRVISNLIVDQTANNPAAVAAATANPGSEIVMSPGLDGTSGTADDKAVNFIPNVKPDFGLTVPFNSWFTFFGQFFDHGLDLVTKGGNGTVFIPLKPDDPLFVPGSPTNFMVLTRATMQPGADGVLGTADDIHEQENTTSPFVDQNQTYSSHPSHQVFLRAYELNAAGAPVATGKLITNRDLGVDGKFGTADDHEIGGMATWAVVKAQARAVLGINLTDANVFDVPLLATDPYGNFIKGPHGLPQVVMKGVDGIGGTADDTLVEGNLAAPISLANAVGTGHQFLIDIAHIADPSGALSPDADTDLGNTPSAGFYDNELLDKHYIAGDGRVNENIGLTAVHAIFHSEHNRLVEQSKETILASNDLAFLNEWLRVDVASLPTTTAQINALQWDGERLFQAAKFGTEMQYQHLVFEEFARTVQPNIDEFLAPSGYDTTIDPSIVAEFAHTVYRFGHSMLVETVDRLDPNFNPITADPLHPTNDQQIGLIAAFLNPLAYAASGLTPEQATGAIARGVTRQVGNEIDEFVTEALRNNLVGLPLDLAVLNLARGRDAGIPSLNAARREFFAMTGDAQLKPYTSWVDMVQQLRHPESLINFIAAYGTHAALKAADVDTTAEKRAVAMALVLGGSATINAGAGDERVFTANDDDRLAFLHSTGAYASGPDGVTKTGVDGIDFWVGGLAERQMPFGGLLGSTFNFVFETQLENLQNADRFYYLSRTAGMNFGTELEQNSFAQLVMLNSDATHLPADIFQTPAFILEINQAHQFNSTVVAGADGVVGTPDDLPASADPTGGIFIGTHQVTPLVIRDNPDTPGPDSNYLHYTGAETVVLGGTPGNDILIAGSSDDDTVYGDAGNDYLEGGFGDDNLFGGAGDDIIQDMGGDDIIHGDAGNDVIEDGHSITLAGNIILGGDGKDFIITTEDVSTIFGGAGDDFILGSKTNLPETGNEGDDWIEKGTQDGSPGDNMNPFLNDDVVGNDIFVGGGGFDEMIGEGGDDIFVGSDAQDKMDGMSGFDWITYKADRYGVTSDLTLPALNEPPIAASPASILDRFAEVEGMSGSAFSDILRGDEADAATIATFTATGSVLTNIGLIAGLRDFLGTAAAGPDGLVGTADDQFGTGNIILGGDGSDLIEGRGGDDLIDGDKWLNVRISVRANVDGTGPEIASFNSMEPMIPLMLNRTYNPGQLVAVREILPGSGGFDTANYRGDRANYTIAVNDNGTPLNFADDVVTVTDNSALPLDGSDRLTHIERLQFADQSVTLVPGLNNDPAGVATIADLNGGDIQTGDFLRASIAGVTDADNPGGAITGDIRFTWQAEFVPGTGVFEDIVLLPAGDLAFESASGAVFRVNPAVDGLSLRVKAMYQDAHGVVEQVFSAATAPVVAVAPPPPTTPVTPPDATEGGPGVNLVRSDLDFILTQIKIAEANAAGKPLVDLIPNVRLAYGLRTVDGSDNNLLDLLSGTTRVDQHDFGAADTTFPRLLTPHFDTAEGRPAGFFGPGDPGDPTPTSYASNIGSVFDSEPRTISNLIVDQTANNPAAVAAAAANDGSSVVTSPGLDGLFGTADDKQVFEIPNIKPDLGLTAPFNAWMTFFGQFFDHGLDLVTKGGSGTVFIPLKPDDPLYVAGSPTNFMVLTRATNLPGPDGVLGTPDDIHEQENTTTPFVDQNQTYTSHPSHQVFLRAYELNAVGDPVATGKLITNHNLGADGHFGGIGANADTEIGGMATWAVVKTQAHDLLGINLTDADVFDVPLLATDAYGNFIKGPNGLPMVMMKGADGISDTADDVLVEGNRAAPIDLANAVRTGHQFLIDIAHSADPSGGLQPDADNVINLAANPPATGFYDNELLDSHYIAGDGRANENIGLTAVHSIFHHEHNRLVDQAMDTVLASNDLAFLNEWLLSPVASLPVSQPQIDALQWNGERLFQVAKFGTEMQYQHLVFEEFARTVQPMVDPFFAPTQVYDVDLNPAIVAEFAHTVYRFGHSMLTETVDRFDPSFNPVTVDPLHPSNDDQLGLIAAFLNPLAFAASGPTPEEATGAIVRGVTRTVGNEIDEFVTEALRNNLVGLPLDLAVLNLARGRDAGIPSLNEARRDFYTQTGDTWVKPYTSWADLVQHLKHPESLVNFIAAYGTHASITGATTLAAKRAAAALLVLGGPGAPADRLDFLNSTGAYANHADGVTVSGVDGIDFWVGGLAEHQTPFGGLLGSTFNFVFENQMEKLQDGDRFYYLERTTGLSFGNELESNSFAKLIMANSDVEHLPGLVFMTPGFTLEVDQSKQFNAHTGMFLPGPDGIPGTADDIEDTHADPTGGVSIGSTELTPLVIRDNPDTIGPDTNYLHYVGIMQDAATVVLGGTEGDDILIAGDSDDDTVWGDGGNDRIDGGYGNDQLRGGAGDDIITDLGGDDNIQGGDGNDVIQGGNGANLILGGFGSDFIITGEDASEAFGGQGNDFILGSKANEQDIGNEGDDWIEKGTSDGAPGDNFDPLGLDPIRGNDVFIGDGENDKFIGEGGDDIMLAKAGLANRSFGGSGFDWAAFSDDATGVTIDIDGRFFDQPPVPGSGASALARFDIVEGLSGSAHDDYLQGDSAIDLIGGEVGGAPGGSALTNIALINGMQKFLDIGSATPVTAFTTGNIIFGGDGSDIMQGRGGDDLIDGDRWLNVRISVRAGHDANGPTGGEIYTAKSMTDATLMHHMLDGTWNPGQLQIVREILTTTTPSFDTAFFAGNFGDYTIDGIGTDVVTVTDAVAARDGIDRLTGIERLQFGDNTTFVLVDGLNNEPQAADGQGGPATLTVSDTSPLVGQQLTVSAVDLVDADNASATNPNGEIRGRVAYFWQSDPGTGVFEDLTVFAAGELSRVEGATFTPTADLAGLALRVRGVYKDDAGNLEQVFSGATAPVVVNSPPVGTVTISDLTPTETVPLTADTSGISDANGLGTFSFQWQRSINNGATWTAISLATAASYTPVQADVNSILRVVVSYVDGAGTVESLTSAPTGGVGDSISGTAANDTLNGTAFDDIINGAVGADVLNGLAGADLLLGNLGTDTLNGGDGNDTLDGGVGTDTMNGGTGDDTYVVESATDVVNEGVGAGTDTVQTNLASYTLGANVENLTFTGGGTNTGIGNGLNNVITGGAGADILSGGLGNDTLIGNAGADTLNGDGGADILQGGIGGDTLNGGDGDDSLDGDVGDDILNGGIGVDTLLGGAGTDTLNGNDGNDILNGGIGADTLDGGTGADAMAGGAGNDTYVVDNVGDVVTELAGDAGDTVRTALASYTLPAEVENLIYTGTGNFVGTGNAIANVITSGAGNDTLSGGAANDTLNGNAGNDLLAGGAGNDTMVGGAGDDTYVVDAAGDVVTEAAGAGTDTVQTVLATYALGANVENLTFTGAGNFAGTGNVLNNVITGGAGNDTLNGGAGDDVLNGGAGSDTATYAGATAGVTVSLAIAGAQNTIGAGTDTLVAIENLTGSGLADNLTGDGNANVINGDAGADILNGGAGNDTLNGGADNDILDGGAGNDTLNGGAGVDTASYASATAGVTVSLAAAVAQNTVGAGTDTLAAMENLTGSGLADALTGDGGANVIDGGAGADTLNGGAGTDTLSGGAGTDSLLGGAANDTLDGGADNDSLDGGAGTDQLAGGTGDDIFLFATSADAGNLATRDVIADFLGDGIAGGDVINVAGIDANTGVAGNQAFAFIGTDAFTAAGQLHYLLDATGNTIIEGNTTGATGAEFQIQVAGVHTFVAGDFVL